MINEKNSLIYNPARKIKCKVEFYKGSTLHLQGKQISVDNLRPIPEQISIFVYSNNLYRNLFDTANKEFDTDGNIIDDNSKNISDFIYVAQLGRITTYNPISKMAFYNADKDLITVMGDLIQTISLPIGCEYVRFSYDNTLTNVMVAPGEETMLPYEPPVDINVEKVIADGQTYNLNNQGLCSIYTSGPHLDITTTSGTANISTTCNTAEKQNDITYDTDLKSIKIDRVGNDNEYFGYGIVNKMEMKVINSDKSKFGEKDIFKVYFTSNDTYVSPFPLFFTTGIKQDEVANETTITAVDSINMLGKTPIISILPQLSTPLEYANLLGQWMGLKTVMESNTLTTKAYKDQLNIDKNTTIRDILDDIAEITATIYTIIDNQIIFKNIYDSPAPIRITKDNYFNLSVGDEKILGYLVITNDLGNDITNKIYNSEYKQFIRNNAFLLNDQDSLDVMSLMSKYLGSCAQILYELKWRGNYCITPLDKIEIETKDGTYISTYLLGDTIEFTGGYKQESKNNCNPSSQKANNPVKIGEAITQTTAKVDKVNKRIDLIAKDINGINADIGQITVKSNEIIQRIDSTEQLIDDNKNEIGILNQKVSQTMSKDAIINTIESEISKGTDKVVTKTGFRFDQDGLTVSKSDKDMKTMITEDGMKVFRDNQEVLVANNKGVDAINLHATTYLIIGNNSRFEDMGTDRTACFWIGGNN